MVSFGEPHQPAAERGVGGLDVMAVVVVHNSSAVLPRCLGALRAAAQRVRAEVLVVDSGSDDDPERICRRFGAPLLRVDNRGLGAAFNRALERPEVRRARYVLQLNPDVELAPRGLDILVASADRRPRCGIMGPRQVDQHGRLILSIGMEPAVGRCWRGVRGDEPEWQWDLERYRSEIEVDWLMGACLLLRSEMLQAIGGFDERFFLCSEEVDLCRRARSAGWSVNYLPAVSATHPLAGRSEDEHRARLEEWSRILYLRKWHAWPARMSLRTARLARLALLARYERRHPGQPGSARVRLRASARFSPRGYGPQPGDRPDRSGASSAPRD